MSVSNTALGIDPIPAWMVAPSGMRSATNDAMRRSISFGATGAASKIG